MKLLLALIAISSAMASTITIGVSGTTTFRYQATASMEFRVYTPADVMLSMKLSGFLDGNCSAIDAAQPWQCSGTLDHLTTVSPLGESRESAAVQISGVFQSPGGNLVDPYASCPNGFTTNLFEFCVTKLQPGYYILTAQAGGEVGGNSNAKVSPFSWSTIGMLNVYSGSVEPVTSADITAPEPAASLLMFAGLSILALTQMFKRVKSYRSRPRAIRVPELVVYSPNPAKPFCPQR